MLTVTEAASARLAHMLQQRSAAETIAVPFVYYGEGIGVQHDSEQAGDTTFQYEGRTFLLLSAQGSKLLAEGTLDLQRAKLTLIRPKKGE